VPDDRNDAATHLRDRVTALVDSLSTILDLDPLAAARVAPRIIDETKSVMAAVRKASIARAARDMTHAQIADGLGVSTSAVNAAIVEHRAHLSAAAPVAAGVGAGGRTGA
jgi:DNA-directed RNA polymerase specialized sigma24 family protein